MFVKQCFRHYFFYSIVYLLGEHAQNYLFFNCVLRKQKELERRERAGKREKRTKGIRKK